MRISLYTKDNTSDVSNTFKDVANIATNINELVDQNPEVIISSTSLKDIPFSKLNNLTWIQLSSAGADKLPKEIVESDIIVTNASGVHPIPIAETIIGYMLSFARNLHIFTRNQHKKLWKDDYSDLKFSELYDQKVLIVGMGSIGSKVADLTQAFSMHVQGIASSKKTINGVRCTPLDTLPEKVKNADYIANALPYTKDTHEIYNKKIFDNMKTTAVFLNIGRGKSVKEDDLIEALKNNRIKGAALDVTYEEPLSKNNPLWDMENVIITPHISGSTPHYNKRLRKIFDNNLSEYKKDNLPLPTQVNKQKGY